jgi:hypothetical protein
MAKNHSRLKKSVGFSIHVDFFSNPASRLREISYGNFLPKDNDVPAAHLPPSASP